MRGSWLCIVLLAVGGVASAQEPPAPDAPAAGVAAQVDELVRRAVDSFESDPGRTWRRAYDLATLGPPAMPRLRTIAEADDALRSLVALRALAELGEPGFAATRACDWTAAGALDIRIAAAELVAALAARHRGDGGEAVRRGLRERLPGLLDETFEPRVKVPLAMALWHAGSDRRAVRELKSLLSSEDPEVVVQAALGLGEAGDVQAARAQLQRLGFEPTPRGRLARAVIERELLAQMLLARPPEGGPIRITGEGLELLEELRAKVAAYYPEEREARTLVLAAARGIAGALDPATEFLEHAGVHGGDGLGDVGLRLAFVEGLPTAIGVRADGPAAALGIRNGDRLLRVAGESVFGKTLDELVQKLRGPVGSSVTVEVWRDQRPRWVRWHPHTLTRVAEGPSALVADRLPAGLGYVRLEALSAASALELHAGLARLRGEPLTALVVDLRGCAAASRESLLAVAAELIGPGRLVYSGRGRHAKLAPPREYRTAGSADDAWTPLPPMAVLVGPGTAGPGELLAAALHHHAAAELVGTKTFGNGQEMYAFPLTTANGQAWLRLPIALHTTADGAKLHGVGLTPDVVVAPSADAGWIETERDAVRVSGAARREAERLVQELEPAAVRALAESDRDDWHAYPGYAEWYAGLGTRAEPEHLRPLLRAALRAVLAARGEAAHVDPRQDRALGRAALRLLARIGAEPDQHPLYDGLAAG